VPPISALNPFLPLQAKLVDLVTGLMTQPWLGWAQAITGQLSTVIASLNVVPGVNVFTVATQPSLGAPDAGYLAWLSDYKHALRWSGTAWEFFGGSNNNFFIDTPAAPQSGLWQLCDGTVTKYLTLGATLTETSFTTPNLAGTPAYKKAAAAYTGTINAAGGSTGTGNTGTGNTGTGNTGTGTTGTGTTGAPSLLTGPFQFQGGGGNTADPGHTHSVPGLSVPALTIPALTVPSLSVPALGVGTLDMANLGVLVYFRR
jgi:hypothetical protein